MVSVPRILRDYRDADGAAGEMQTEFRVYGRDGEPCFRCGHPIEKNDVRIVDDAGRELGERYEGMLEFRGPSMTKGYFRNEAKTRELFHDGWIKSGDRAYMAGGDVYITGRVRTSSSAPAAIPTRRRSRKRSRPSRGSARAASRRSVRPIRRTAPSG